MDFETLYWLLPEILVASAALLTLLVGICEIRYKETTLYIINQATLLITMLICYKYLGLYIASNEVISIATDTIKIDAFSLGMKLLICTMAFIYFVYSKESFASEKNRTTEFYSLTMFSLLGIMVLVSSNNFVTLYIGLELLSLPLYALIALSKSREDGPEASIKYFILGGIASTIMLFGISLIYGINGTLSLGALGGNGYAEVAQVYYKVPFLLGVCCVWLGIAFKLGAAPFHMWVPDVYQGASLPVTMLISTLPKLGAFGMVYRVFFDSFTSVSFSIYLIIKITAVLSILIGTLCALKQDNIKRLLAYSTIANIGYMLLAVLIGAYEQALFYLVVYILVVMGTLGTLLTFVTDKELEEIEDLAGLGRKKPLLGLMMVFFLFSMAGIPPFVGFYAKLIVLQSLLFGGELSLVILVLLMSVVGVFYYIKIVKVIYFDENKNDVVFYTEMSSPTSLSMLVCNGIAVLLLGIYPLPLMNICTLLF